MKPGDVVWLVMGSLPYEDGAVILGAFADQPSAAAFAEEVERRNARRQERYASWLSDSYMTDVLPLRIQTLDEAQLRFMERKQTDHAGKTRRFTTVREAPAAEGAP